MRLHVRYDATKVMTGIYAPPRALAKACGRLLARAGLIAIPLAASALTMVPATQASAAGGVSVFVGYADSVRAQAEFPNPWAGSPNVTFDGCTPAATCTFDAGAVRVYNTGSATIHVDQVSVDIAGCTYTWAGALYPVALPPLGSLIVTQRSPTQAPGCSGPDPASFDSSDIPSESCTNDGILPVVQVTVDGVATSGTDSGQVLNTGGVDPGVCGNTNESTEWVKLGSKPCPGQTMTLEPAGQTDPVDTTATVTASFTNSCGDPLSGVLVSFIATSGPNAGITGTGVTDPSGNATFSYSSHVTGVDVLQASVTNAAGFVTRSNTVAVDWTVEFAPGGGSFVIGDRDAMLGSTVNFWGAQWAKENRLSGGPAPRSFKGFAESPAAPNCGDTWTADPGNSTPPPDGPLPALMGVIVTSSAHKTGPTISGNVVEIVIVRTGPGYEPNPGHAAGGTVVAVVCGGPVAAATGRQAAKPPTSKPPLSTQTAPPAGAAPGGCVAPKQHGSRGAEAGSTCGRLQPGRHRGKQ